MNVYITGISGFLGINLVRYLLQEGGFRISGIDLEPFNYPEMDQIDFTQGDIRNIETLARSMAGADIVIHCAAALPLYTPEEIFSTDVQGTRNVLNEAKKIGVKRMIHISSTAVYGVPDHHPLYEHDPKIGVGPYGEAKVQAEEVCEEFRSGGMCVPVLRPKSFVGPERLGVFAIMYEWADEGKNFPMIGSGKNRYQLLDVEDLCRAIGLCIRQDREIANDTYNIGAADYTTMREDYQSVMDAAGHGKRIVTFPAGPVIFVLRILEKLNLSPLYPWIYETAAKDSFVSIEKAQQKLGYTPQFSNKQAMLRNFAWYQENIETLRNAEGGVTHRVPWKQKALKVVKLFF
ncbi:MAG: NAD-dependent epimerase/dehydratase family protein [Anaerolineales bacterium]|nr:NAD-dependent epimerase/dehydratase family protein [Anaerolineales bacterium]